MIAVVHIHFWFEAEDRFEAIQAFLAEFGFIFLNIFCVVLAPINPFIKESGQEIAVALIFTLILAETDVKTIVAAAGGRMGAVGAVDNGQGFVVGNDDAVGIASDLFRLNDFLASVDDTPF